MTTASEPTNYIYSALSAANIDPELAHNACEQMLNLAGRNIIDHVDTRFATLEKDIAQLGETVKKDIAHLSSYLKWLIPFHCALVVGILATLVVNMFS